VHANREEEEPEPEDREEEEPEEEEDEEEELVSEPVAVDCLLLLEIEPPEGPIG
jgi:hypothetical protein